MEKIKSQNLIAKEKNKEKKFIFEELPEVKEKSKSTYIITFFVFFIILFSGILDFIIKKLGIKFNTLTIPMIYNVIISLISCFALFIILKENIKRDLKFFAKNKMKYLDFRLTVWIICGVIAAIIFFFISMAIGENSANETRIDKLPLLYLLITGVILGPFMEECMFRGLLKKIIKNKYLFLIISSIFFGIMHVITVTNNPMQYLFVITYSIQGFALGYMYEKTDNLVLPIVIHMLSNTLGII